MRTVFAAVAALAVLVTASAPVPASAAAVRPAQSWQRLDTPAFKGKQDDIAFTRDGRVGFYGNGEGKLYRTVDSGDSWQLVLSRPGTFVRALGLVDGRIGLLGNIGTGLFPGVSDPTPLYRTIDGGASWSPVTAITGAPVAGVCAIDVLRSGKRTILHAGGRVGGPAVLLRSDDLGQSWTARDLSPLTAMILDVRFLSPRVGFIAGATTADARTAHAVILRTADGGKSWKRVYEGRRASEIIWKLAFPTARVGYATLQSYDPEPEGGWRHVLKSIDGGRRWAELRVVSDPKWRGFGIGFADTRRGWVGGSSGGFETRDGGRSWTPAPFGRMVNKIRIVEGPRGRHAFAIGSEVHRLRLD